MRVHGYYWCFGNKCYHQKTWKIYYWNGMFWEDVDDFSEDCFEEIDEKQIIRIS